MMNSLDRIIKRQRKHRYKRLRKLFKARDMASKYVNKVVAISKVDDYFDLYEEEFHTTGMLAKEIVDKNERILRNATRPSKPPAGTLKKRK